MKRLAFITLSIALIICCVSTVHAQRKKPFNATIKYSISYPDSDLDAAVLAAQPAETQVMVFGNKSKSEIVIQGMLFLTQITNGDNRSSITMIDAGGQKIFYRMNEEEIKAQLFEIGEPVTELTDETIEIAGHTCKKAIVTQKDSYGDEYSLTVYYVPNLVDNDFSFNNSFKDIPGLPLKYELKQGEQKIVFEAVEIKKAKHKDKHFLIPSDFRELSPEEKQELINAFKEQG